MLLLLFVSETGKVDPTPHTSSFNMGYLVSPYPYPNGAGGPIPVSMVSRSPVMLLFGFIPVKFGMPRTCHYSSSLLFSSDNGRVRTASFVRAPDLTCRTVPRAGSWSRYWFMASANWIHDLYLQPRARVLGLSLSFASLWLIARTSSSRWPLLRRFTE